MNEVNKPNPHEQVVIVALCERVTFGVAKPHERD